MISTIEHLSMYLCAICMSWEKCLFRSSGLFLIGFFFFLLMSCMSYLHILVINPISDIWFGNIFSDSIVCLFILLICWSFLVWCIPTCLVFAFVCCFCFCSQIQKKQEIIVRTSVKEPNFHVFCLKFYDFMSYIQVFNPLWFHFCVCVR